MVSAEAQHVLDALGASSTLKTLRREHRIIVVTLALKRHEQVVKVLEILLQEFVSLVIINSVGKAIKEAVYQLVELEHRSLQGLHAVDVSPLLQVGKVIAHVDLVVHLKNDCVDPCF